MHFDFRPLFVTALIGGSALFCVGLAVGRLVS
jgi:hypothetical protein